MSFSVFGVLHFFQSLLCRDVNSAGKVNRAQKLGCKRILLLISVWFVVISQLTTALSPTEAATKTRKRMLN